ncbi:UNVERIFIED_CONTAM: hypothetical protein Sradi_2886500 [Sesamum radiatum]|uniref:Uncharacterized protein n=1 Tax=Sesamum radiatum TaxID=300843 RepID=A0AAW2RYE8_SESRA
MEEWVIQVDQRVSQTSTGESQADRNTTSIYRVPSEEHVTFVCKPSRVSFGPYYNGDVSCSQTVERKEGSLVHFLARSRKPLKSYVETLTAVVQHLKDSYHQLERKWRDDTEGFLWMMILDGCFLIEVLRSGTNYYSGDHSRKNPVFEKEGIHGSEKKYYRLEMLLLENQLPMLLLLKLISVERGNDSFRKQEFPPRYYLGLRPSL